MKAEFRKYVDDDGTEGFKFAGVTDGVLICPHLGVLPDGTRPTYRFVDLGDGKTGAMPDRLYVEVHTDDGRTVIIDATTTEAGIPEVHSVTITRTDGSPLDIPADVGERVLWSWVMRAAMDTIAFSSTAYFGDETPDGLDPLAARRELKRRMSATRRPGKPPPDPRKVAKALELHASGLTYEAIGESVGRTTSTIGRWIKKYGPKEDES